MSSDSLELFPHLKTFPFSFIQWNTDKEKIDEISLTKCYLDGQQYVKGQAMYPDSHKCHSCVCETGFDNGTIVDNPHCSKIDCNIQFHHGESISRGCIPVYYEDATCCPISWRCRKYCEYVYALYLCTQFF